MLVFSHFTKYFDTNGGLHMQISANHKILFNISPRGLVPGHFVPPNRWKFRTLVIFSKVFHRFRNILILHAHLGYAVCVFQLYALNSLFLGLESRLQQSLSGRQASCYRIIWYRLSLAWTQKISLQSHPVTCLSWLAVMGFRGWTGWAQYSHRSHQLAPMSPDKWNCENSRAFARKDLRFYDIMLRKSLYILHKSIDLLFIWNK